MELGLPHSKYHYPSINHHEERLELDAEKSRKIPDINLRENEISPIMQTVVKIKKISHIPFFELFLFLITCDAIVLVAAASMAPATQQTSQDNIIFELYSDPEFSNKLSQSSSITTGDFLYAQVNP